MRLLIIFFVFSLFVKIFNDLIELNENINDKEYLFVFSIINTGDNAPKGLNILGEDLYNEVWTEASQELTGLGARKLYLLGKRNKQRYSNFISNYVYNEFILRTQNCTRCAQSLFSHMTGMFENTGPELRTEQDNKKSTPHTTIDNLDELIAILNKKALLNGRHAYRINTIQDYEMKIGLESESKCEGVSDYLSKNIDTTLIDQSYNIFKNRFADSENNRTKILLMVENLVKDYNHSRDLLILDESSREEYYTKAFDLYHKYITYSKHFEYSNIDEKNWISRISSSRIFKEILDLLNTRNKDKNAPYTTTNPKYSILSVKESTFISISNFLKICFNSLHELKNIWGSSFQIELLEESFIRVIFNDEVIFNGKFDEFDQSIMKFQLTDDKINDFCVNHYTLNTEFDLFLATLIIGILSLIFCTYAVFLKCKKDSFEKVFLEASLRMSNTNTNLIK